MGDCLIIMLIYILCRNFPENIRVCRRINLSWDLMSGVFDQYAYVLIVVEEPSE